MALENPSNPDLVEKPSSSSGIRGTDRLLSHVGWVAGLTLLVKVAGFVEKQVHAYYFGTSDEMDAFYVAQSYPMMFFFILSAVVGPTILPMFIRRTSQGDRKGAWGQVFTWAIALTILLGCVCLFSLTRLDSIVVLLAPGFEKPLQLECSRMLLWMLPSVAFLGLLPLFVSILNAEKLFPFPPVANGLLKIVPVGVMLVCASRLGVESAVIGFVIASLCAFSLCATRLLRTWIPEAGRPSILDPDFRAVLLLMTAPAIGTVFSQLGSIVETRACSELATGTVSAFQFARKIVDFPLLIVPVAAATVLYTYFAEFVHRRDSDAAAKLLTSGVRFMLFLFVPLTLLTVELAPSLVSIVYERGSFDSDSTKLVATALYWLAPTMGLLAVEALIMRHFFSRVDLWPPTFIGVFCVAVKVFLIWLLVVSFGLAGLCCAIFLSRFLKVVLLLAGVCLRGSVSIAAFQSIEILKVVVASVAAAVCAKGALRSLQWDSSFTFADNITRVAGVALLFGAVYVSLTYLFRTRECLAVKERLLRRSR